MGKTKRWSEQSLVQKTLKTHESNEPQVINTLEFCVSGLDKYRKHFQTNSEHRKILPDPRFYEFIVTMDTPRGGQFYELEYFLGENGTVYRALIQAPAYTDLPMIIAIIREHNRLPQDFNPHKAYLRTDIDAVHECYCSYDNEFKDWALSGGVTYASIEEQSLMEHHAKFSEYGECAVYWRGPSPVEMWSRHTTDYSKEKPIFVAGSDNANDEEFAIQRQSDMEEFRSCLDMASDIADEYNIDMCLCYASDYDKDAKERSYTCCTSGESSIPLFTAIQFFMQEHNMSVKDFTGLLTKAFASKETPLNDVPVNYEFEQIVLGQMLISQECAEKAPFISRDLFMYPANQLIFDYIFELVQNKKPVDVISVYDLLKLDNIAPELYDGLTYLTDLSTNVISDYNFDSHVKHLQERYDKANNISTSEETSSPRYKVDGENYKYMIVKISEPLVPFTYELGIFGVQEGCIVEIIEPETEDFNRIAEVCNDLGFEWNEIDVFKV